MLVADDNAVVLQVTVAMLGQMGCRVMAVTGGLLALEALSTGDFDLALLDCRMPDLDGIRAVRAFRELEQGRGDRRLPIVALSGNTDVVDRTACRDAGMDGFLGKPFGQLDLLETVRRFVPNAAQPVAAPVVAPLRSPTFHPGAAIDRGVLAELEAMRPGLRATTFTGFVPDARPHLLNARIGVVPERTGGGFKLKLLDYLFHGLPTAVVDNATAGWPADMLDMLLRFHDLPALARGIVAAIDDLPRLNDLQRRALESGRTAFAWPDRGIALRQAVEALQRAGA